VRGSLGLDAFTDEAVADPAVRALAVNIRYEVDPANPYPRAFTGHIRATLRDGRSLEERQPHMRGGAHAPLTRAEIEAKLAGNARVGGWTQAQIDAAHTLAKSIWHAAHIDLADLRG
jgi:2-methylcitrate dehydratase PrpD